MHMWEMALHYDPVRNASAYASVAYCPRNDEVFYGATLHISDSTPTPVAQLAASGAACTKCKEYYPYAVPVAKFVCYGCRC